MVIQHHFMIVPTIQMEWCLSSLVKLQCCRHLVEMLEHGQKMNVPGLQCYAH
jgi:hypothetical protein